LGANAEQVSAILPSDVKVYRSVNWQDGLSASLRVAATNVPDNCTHVLIALGDQIAISTTEYHQLIEHSIQNPNHIVCTRYDGRNGVPAIFPVSYMSQLSSLSGDKGAGQLLNRSDAVKTLDFDSAAHDIDTPDDLMRVLSILK
jgi:molybdenum cofactor cytidylyltransferase